MSTPLGEEFIRIRPDASTFRAELQAQIAAAMTGVKGQIAQAQAQLRSTSVAAAAATTPSGIILPPGVRAATQQAAQAATQQAAATTRVATAARATNAQLQALSTTQRAGIQTTRNLQRSVASAETAVGRYSRGMVAATAASTGFFRAVSFASGAFLVGATLGATIAAAVQEFSQMTTVGAQTVQIIKATGGAANVTAEQVDELSRSVLQLTGVDDELIKQGANVLLTFRAIRNEAGQGNQVFDRAVKAAADISTVFRTDLRGSAVQLGKALQDPVRGVTALRRSGISLTQGQRELIKELVASGAVLTAQKLILGEVERQVGGTAEAIGRTLPGQLRIMRENAINSLGDLVKRLSASETAANAVTGAAEGMSQAWSALRSVLTTIGPPLLGIGRGLGNITQAIGGVGVLLGAVAAYKAIGLAAHAAATAQGLFAAASAGAAQASFLQAVASGKATVALQEQALAEVAAARAAQKTLGAMAALSGIFALGAAASGQWTLALIAGGVALASVTAKAVAAARALRAAGTAVTAVRVATAALGGPIGVAAVAAGALAVGLIAIARRSGDAATSLRRTKSVLDQLNQSLDENQRLRAEVGTAREQFGVAQFDVRGAERDLENARQRLAATAAQPGSLEFRFLEDQIRVAREKLADATTRLADAQVALNLATEQSRVSEAAQPALIRALGDELKKTIEATRQLAAPDAKQRVEQLTSALMLQGLSYDQATAKARSLVEAQLEASGATQNAVDQVIDRYQKLANSEEGAARVASAAIAVITGVLNRLPTQKQIDIVVQLSSRGESVQTILSQLGIITSSNIELQRTQARASTDVTAALREQRAIAQGLLKRERDRLKTISEEATKRRETLRATRLEVEAAQDAVAAGREARTAAAEGLADAQRGLGDAQRGLADAQRGVADAQRNLNDAIRESARAVADARRSLADTIRESQEAVAEAIRSAREEANQAIQDAKGNLLSLNRSIASSIAEFLEKTAAAPAQLSARMRTLRAQLQRGAARPEALRAAQEIQFSLQQQEPSVDVDTLKRQFDDLTDSFVRGRITLQQYDRRFSTLTKNINIQKFREMFGTAAANEFMDMIRTSRRQAVLIKEAPQKTGAAIAQTLVNPLRTIAEGTRAVARARLDAARDISDSKRSLADALRQQTRNIATAQRGVQDAQRGVQDAQRGIEDAARGIVRAQREIVRADRQLAAAERRLRQAQHKETIANTRAVKKNTEETKQLRVVLQAKSALLEVKPKPQGRIGEEANRARAGVGP